MEVVYLLGRKWNFRVTKVPNQGPTKTWIIVFFLQRKKRLRPSSTLFGRYHHLFIIICPKERIFIYFYRYWHWMLDPYTIQHVLELQHLSIVGDVFSLKLLATTFGMSMGTRDNKLSLRMSISWGQQTSRNNDNNNQCGNAMHDKHPYKAINISERYALSTKF